MDSEKSEVYSSTGYDVSYSPSLNIFMITSSKADYPYWPDDAFEVTQETFREYSVQPPEGKIRVAGKDGMPTWADAPPPTHEDLVQVAISEKARLRAIADAAIAPLQDAQDLDMATDKESSDLIAWKKFRVLLNRIDTSKPPIEWPEQPQ